VEIRHRKADFLVGLKTTGGRVHLRALDINVGSKREYNATDLDTWWLEGVL